MPWRASPLLSKPNQIDAAIAKATGGFLSVMVFAECFEAIHILVARLRFHEFTAFYMTQLSEESASGRCFRAWLVLIMLGLGKVCILPSGLVCYRCMRFSLL